MKRLVACSPVLVLVLALAACGGAPQKPVAAGAAPAKTASAAKPAPKPAPPAATPPAAPEKAIPGKAAPEKAAPEKEAPETANPLQSAAVTPEKPEPTEPEIPVDDDPAQFMNGGVADLREVLGDPVLIRRDGPAEVWQFQGDSCTLDLFLYPGDGGALAVKHVDLRGDAPDESRACLARMIRARIVAAEG